MPTETGRDKPVPYAMPWHTRETPQGRGLSPPASGTSSMPTETGRDKPVPYAMPWHTRETPQGRGLSPPAPDPWNQKCETPPSMAMVSPVW